MEKINNLKLFLKHISLQPRCGINDNKDGALEERAWQYILEHQNFIYVPVAIMMAVATTYTVIPNLENADLVMPTQPAQFQNSHK
jgi:hypothetical protein